MSVRTTSRPRRSAPTEPRAKATAVPPDRRIFGGVVTLAVLSVGGGVISVAGGLSATIWEAMGPTGRLSIPIPMMLAQLAAAWLAAGSRRRPAIVGSALLTLVEPICVVSGFFDGGYSDPARTSLDIAYQCLLISGIAVVGVIAAVRLISLLRVERDSA